MQHNNLIKLFAGLITIVLVAFLLSHVNIADIASTLANSNPLYLILGFFFYTISYFFRALRFWLLLNSDLKIKDLFNVVCVHNMMNNLLPARTGELSYIYLLNKVHGRSVGEGIATLVIARLFDFTVIAGIFICAALMSQFILSNPKGYIIWFATITLVLCISLLIILLKKDKTNFLTHIERIFCYNHMDEKTLRSRILCKIKETSDAFDAMETSDPLFYFKIAITSIGLWGSLYGFYYWIALAMNLDVNFIPAVFASSFAVFTTVLPIQGIGGFGTMEGGWAVGFILVGVPPTDAIASGFGFHIIMLVYTVIFGVYGLLFLKYRSLKEKRTP